MILQLWDWDNLQVIDFPVCCGQLSSQETLDVVRSGDDSNHSFSGCRRNDLQMFCIDPPVVLSHRRDLQRQPQFHQSHQNLYMHQLYV